MGIIAAVYISVLIFIGAIYVVFYDAAPIWERIHILAVGLGMWIGVSILLLS